MGKTHDALLKAEKENAQRMLQPIPKPVEDRSPVLWDPFGGVPQLIPEWFKELKIRLEVNHADRSPQTLLFTSTSLKNGCSSIAAGFARCLSSDFNKRVLLLDVNIRNPNLQNIFGNQFIQDLEEILEDNKLGGLDQRTDRWSRNLHVVNCTRKDLDSSLLLGSDAFKAFLQTARQIFDYTILDSSPVTLFSETRLLCPMVDGVILVIEAGRTRRRAAVKAKNEIESAGGTLLGSVLNKRKFYIPGWLYRRL